MSKGGTVSLATAAVTCEGIAALRAAMRPMQYTAAACSMIDAPDAAEGSSPKGLAISATSLHAFK
jgi:hypothetical protein